MVGVGWVADGRASAVWLCGCVAVWLCGCVAVWWLCGCVASWVSAGLLGSAVACTSPYMKLASSRVQYVDES